MKCRLSFLSLAVILFFVSAVLCSNELVIPSANGSSERIEKSLEEVQNEVTEFLDNAQVKILYLRRGEDYETEMNGLTIISGYSGTFLVIDFSSKFINTRISTLHYFKNSECALRIQNIVLTNITEFTPMLPDLIQAVLQHKNCSFLNKSIAVDRKYTLNGTGISLDEQNTNLFYKIFNSEFPHCCTIASESDVNAIISFLKEMKQKLVVKDLSEKLYKLANNGRLNGGE